MHSTESIREIIASRPGRDQRDDHGHRAGRQAGARGRRADGLDRRRCWREHPRDPAAEVGRRPGRRRRWSQIRDGGRAARRRADAARRPPPSASRSSSASSSSTLDELATATPTAPPHRPVASGMSASMSALRVGAESYALPVDDVLEVAELGDADRRSRRAGAGVLGVRNLRGQVLPVIDLAHVLGAPARRGRRSGSSSPSTADRARGPRRRRRSPTSSSCRRPLEEAESAATWPARRSTDGALVGVDRRRRASSTRSRRRRR